MARVLDRIIQIGSTMLVAMKVMKCVRVLSTANLFFAELPLSIFSKETRLVFHAAVCCAAVCVCLLM